MKLKRLVKKVQNVTCRKFYINTNHKLKNTILVAGTGRSGTTWLSDLINYNNVYRDIFEPFTPEYTKEWKSLGYKPYIRPNYVNSFFYNTTFKILCGMIKNDWVDQYNMKFICGKRIVKEIRCNLFLEWIHQNFKELKIVFIIRHPFAVALSRTKLGWPARLDSLLSQKELIDDHLSNFQLLLKEKHDQFIEQVILWCIENYVPIKQLSTSDIYPITYERLCENTSYEIKMLFEWLNIPYCKDIQKKFKIPSTVTSHDSPILAGKNAVEEWKEKISDSQIEKGIRILALFGLNRLYDESPFPKTDRIFNVL